MGSPKALIPREGIFLFEHMAHTLAGSFTSVIISHKKDSFSLPATDFPVIADVFEERSPMSGILSALITLQSPVFVVPVDVPGLSEDVVEYLISRRVPNNFCTVFFNDNKKIYDPLIGIWELSAIEVLESRLKNRQLSFLCLLREQHIPERALPQAHKITKLNTKDEYKKWVRKGAK